MKRLILFGSICLTLAVVASAMATQAPRVFTVADRLGSDLVMSDSPSTGKAYADTFFLMGGNRPADSYTLDDGPTGPVNSYWSGKFEDGAGPNWQGWDYSWMSPVPGEGTWPGWDYTFSPVHQWSITGDKGTGYPDGQWGWWEAWMNPTGQNLVLPEGAGNNRSLWVGQYAPATWRLDPRPPFQPNAGWVGKPGHGNYYGGASWLTHTYPATPDASLGDLELFWSYDWHVSCSNANANPPPPDPPNAPRLFMEYYNNEDEEWEILAHHDGGALYGGADSGFGEINQIIPAVQHAGQLQLRIRFSTVTGTDEDNWFHSDRGGAILDNISVEISEVGSSDPPYESFEDFETLDPTEPVADDLPISFGQWAAYTPGGVGNFPGIYHRVQGEYPAGQPDGMCEVNHTWFVSFANIGQYANQPVGSSHYIPARPANTYNYGPNLCQVEWDGGMDFDDTLWNIVVSPIMDLEDLPAGLSPDIVFFTFDVFRHVIWPDPGTSTRVFYQRGIRFGETIEELEDSGFGGFNSIFFGGPDWFRHRDNFIATAGSRYVQVALGAYQHGKGGMDGTPAPYFDSVVVGVYELTGPAISVDPIYLAQDNFPVGINLANKDDVGNRIRFDGAWDLNPRTVAAQRIMDSIAVSITVPRAGYEHDLDNPPRVYVAIKPNPVFTVPLVAHATPDAAYDRAYPSGPLWGFRDYEYSDGIITFWKYMEEAWQTEFPFERIENRWWFDLDGNAGGHVAPDPVFFPGDIIHYYIQAWDRPDSTGVGPSRTVTLPSNTDHFGNFDQAGQYSLDFTVRGLPAVNDGATKSLDTATNILWINAFGNRGGAAYWRTALANNGLHEWGSNPGVANPVYYDTYHVHRPDNTGGNHIEGRATILDIENYDTILFCSGNMASNVLGSATEEGGGIYGNKTNCIQLFQEWLDQGGKNLALMGNDIAYSNNNTGPGSLFNNTYLGINFLSNSLGVSVGSQFAPMVRPLPETNNPVLEPTTAYVAWGDCPAIQEFDEVLSILGTSERFAAFATAGSNPPDGTWTPHAPAAGIYRAWSGNQVIYTPYDLIYVRGIPNYTYPDKYPAGWSARAVLLGDILAQFGTGSTGNQTSVPENRVLTVSNFPNPFNPATTIQLSLPHTGEVSLKVYNVRGELVRTLVNNVLEQGEHEFVWDGTNDRGAQTASGIYFYETRANGEVKVNKMALVK